MSSARRDAITSSIRVGPLRFAALRLVVAFVCCLCAPPAVEAQIAAVATVDLTPGWATFGQALPQGAATGALQVGTLATQTDVKNTWPDGSIRFAIVTVKATTAGRLPIVPAVPAPGSFVPRLPTASVALTIAGVAYSAQLPATPAVDRWLSGPLVYEGRVTVAPSSATGGTHPFLRVIFDTRVYTDGGSRVDVTVENVLDKVDAATVTYDVAIAVNGTPVFTQAAVEHFYLTRWRKTFPAGGTTFASIRPDVAAFTRANAVPPYLGSVVTNVVSTPDAANFGILQSGALDRIMSDHGGRAELAPLPDWTARYLVHTDPAQRAFVLANGDLSGSWPVHMREAEDSTRHGVGAERLLSLDERPNLWLDERAQSAGWDYVAGTPLPMREYGTDIPGVGQSPLLPDNAHQPSIAFVPYLLTGDRFYAEEMAFWANYAMLRTYPGDGVRTWRGILENGEVRAFGWALRNLADAAAYYPDASTVKSYLSEKVVNNLQWLDGHARAQDPIANPFQILWVNMRPDGPQYIALWEQAYLAYAIDRANRHGFVGGLAERDAIARFHLKLFTSDPDYPRAEAGAYVIAVGTPSAANPAVFGTYFTTMAQIWAGTQGQERPFAGFYGTEARLNLIYGVQNGWPGAQAAYDYLWPFIGTALTPCVTLGGAALADLTCRAGWAIDFPPTAATAAAAQVTSPSPGSVLSAGTQVFTWTAAVGASAYQITVGTAQGANDLYSGPQVTTLSASVAGLPTGGGAIWVRLSWLMSDGWHFIDSSYVAASAAPATAAAPTKAGSLVAGTFYDATGHSAQSHLVYAPNAGVWWLFTLSSAHDSFADHTVRSYFSNGPNLAGATWTAAAPSPHLANAGFATDAVFAGGRSLGAAVLSIAGADYAHLFASTAFDGQVASNGHIRARLGTNAIEWGAWDNPGSPNAASQWQGPPNSGNPPSAAFTHSSWGNVIGISTGGFIHHSSVTMDQEVDCAAARSTNADVAAAWTNGFGVNAVGDSPPNAVAVIDKSMVFECKSAAFAPLAANVMLAVYSNGAVAQPNLTNLRFQRSAANGSWTNVAGSGGGNGAVFSTDATIDANDWALVPVSTTAVYAFRRSSSGTGVDAATYVAASNTWTPMSSLPPAFGPGQAAKSGAGLFGASDGTSIWLFCINTDAANSILYSTFNGSAWTPWATVAGTTGGAQTRRFISGYPRVVGNQVGLIWTEGTTAFDVVTAALNTDTAAPVVSITAPQPGATVSGAAVVLSANASDNVGIAGVQFLLDGTNLGAELTSSPYTTTWDTRAAVNGAHTLTAVARDAVNNTATAASVTVTVNNDTVPPTVTATPLAGTFTAAQSVVLAVSEPAAIFYTVDGSSPTTASMTYAAPIVIAATTTLRYLAIDSAGNAASGALLYTISSPAPPPAPTATAPVPSIVNHSTLTTTAVPVTLTWSASASADGTAVARYDLQQSIDGGATWTAMALPAALSTSVVQNLVPSPTTAYLFRVRATDAAGRIGAFATGAPFTVIAVQEDDPTIVYGGSWPIAARANAFGGSTSSTNVAGSTATYTFTGSFVAWVTEKDPTHGQAVVSIDGVATPLTDNYNAGTLPRRVMAVSALPAGVHTIRVTVLATKSPAATDTRTDIDAFIVLGTPSGPAAPTVLPTTTTISAPAITAPAGGTAVVTVSSTGGIPSGNVSLAVDGGVPVPLPLVNGAATFTIASPAVGTHTLTATYGAQGKFSASTATGTLTVNGPAPVPTATAPVPSIVNHSTLTTTAVPVTLTWSASASADGSAVARYDLQQSIDGGATWTAMALPAALSTSIVQNLVPSRTTAYLFRVRATDAAGRIGAFATGAPFTVIAVQEDDPTIVYGGSWPIAARTNAFGGSTSSTNVAGSTATYTFTGSFVAWVTEKDPTHGQAVVSIDGVATPLTDNYNAGTLPRRVMAVSALPAGVHTIRVTVLATKSPAATDTRTDLDAFIVLGVP